MIPVTNHASLTIIKSHTTLNRLFTTSMTSLKEISDTGSCGIKKWDLDKIREKDKARESKKMTLPEHLIRPVCMPGGAKGGFQTCLGEEANRAMYCLAERVKYKYPSFSENIDFVPPKADTKCWWHGGEICLIDEDEAALSSLTRQLQRGHHISKEC